MRKPAKKNERRLARIVSSEIAPVGMTQELMDDVAEFTEAADADATREAYASDWRHFEAWCARHGFESIPADPSTVAGYVVELAKGKADDLGPRKSSTIRRRLATIAVTHGRRGLDDPTKDARVKMVWRGIRRKNGIRSQGKAALLREQARLCAATEPDTLIGVRNRVLILYSFESAKRRSETIAMRVEDLVFSARGVVYTFPKSKTNQEGELEWIGIERENDAAMCPVAMLEAWIARAGIRSGFVFPSDRKPGQHMDDCLVARVIKAAVRRTGVGDERLFAGHSTRRGHVTSATRAGKGDAEIRERTRHRSSAMLDVYRERGKRELWSTSKIEGVEK